MSPRKPTREWIRRAAGELVARSATCLLSSIDKEGFPVVRAMLAPREREGMNTFFFSTNTSSRHVAEYAAIDKAGLYFYDPDLFQGLLLRGKMETSTEESLRRRIWRDGDEIYYHLGVDDPDYTVMRFTASSGRWYSDFCPMDF